MNISFIVIGKNEAVNLLDCFNSIYQTIKHFEKTKFECIFIDSDSTDNSVQIAKEHQSVNKVIKLSGNINSAIARNVGVFYSTGSILFFVDGDMKLNPSFLQNVLDSKKTSLIYPVVTGDLINITNRKESYYYGSKLTQDQFNKTTGGIFIIERKLWIKYNGMDPRFKRSQDLDFFFSLSSNGIQVLRKKELICYHNTIPYHSKNRIWEALKNKYSLYSGLFYRNNLLKSIGIYQIIFRRDYSSILLLFLLIISLIINAINWVLILYLLIIFLRNFLSEKRLSINYVIYRIVSDIYVLLGLFFFYPKRKKNFDIEIHKI